MDSQVYGISVMDRGWWSLDSKGRKSHRVSKSWRHAENAGRLDGTDLSRHQSLFYLAGSMRFMRIELKLLYDGASDIFQFTFKERKS